jgi:protein-tyrosine phosphatase
VVSVLFVCLGNICRSPAAEGLLRHLAAQDPEFKDLYIESCGLGDWHVGQLPDERIRAAAKDRDIILSSRAQCFHPSFFERFDYILAADHEVLHELQRVAKGPEQKAKIHLITAFSTTYFNEEIPDPYYQGKVAFDLVLDMLEDACEGFLAYLKKQDQRPKVQEVQE